MHEWVHVSKWQEDDILKAKDHQDHLDSGRKEWRYQCLQRWNHKLSTPASVIVFSIFLIIAVTFIVTDVAPRALTSPVVQAQASTPSDYELQFKAFTLQGREGAILRGWIIPSHVSYHRGTMVLLHGFHGTKSDMLEAANHYARSGFDVVLYDSRSHGESSGKATFGYYEKEDLSAVIDLALSRQLIHEPIGVFGNSYGGAVALQTMSRDRRISFGIVESTFTRFETIVSDYLKIQVGSPFTVISKPVVWHAGRLANFDPSKVQPAQDARHIIQPILVIHGDSDDVVPIYHGREIYNNLSSPRKVWHHVPGGGHAALHLTGGKAYTQTITRFLDTHAPQLPTRSSHKGVN